MVRWTVNVQVRVVCERYVGLIPILSCDPSSEGRGGSWDAGS